MGWAAQPELMVLPWRASHPHQDISPARPHLAGRPGHVPARRLKIVQPSAQNCSVRLRRPACSIQVPGTGSAGDEASGAAPLPAGCRLSAYVPAGIVWSPSRGQMQRGGRATVTITIPARVDVERFNEEGYLVVEDVL